jgi:hypothetical protein
VSTVCSRHLFSDASGKWASRDSGQAAVESALVLPLLTFVVLGTLQLFLMMQGRILAQYAVARATRAGSMAYGDCTRMTHAAIAALMPSIVSFASPAYPGASNGAKLANAFRARMTNAYSPTEDLSHFAPGSAAPTDIVWLAREAPTLAQVNAVAGGTGEDDSFDQFTNGGLPQDRLMRLEVRMIYWFPLRIPFANWVMARMFVAQWGLQAYVAQNPLMLTQTAHWTGDAPPPQAQIASALQARVNAGEYVVPIDVNYTMRMMTPVKVAAFPNQNCPPTPAGI